jgi:hypothetical protein
MSTKSRQRIYGASIRASAQRAKEAPKEADRLACEAWNMRLPGFTGPADKEERRGVVRSQRRQATVCVRWPRTEFKGDRGTKSKPIRGHRDPDVAQENHPEGVAFVYEVLE